MLLDGLLGALIGAGITVVASYLIMRQQSKEDSKREERRATGDAARGAFVPVSEFAVKMSGPAVRASVNQNDPTATKTQAGDLLSLIVSEYQKVQAPLLFSSRELDNQLGAFIDVQKDSLTGVLKDGDGFKLFNVAMDMQEELTGIARKLLDVITPTAPKPVKKRWWKKAPTER